MPMNNSPNTLNPRINKEVPIGLSGEIISKSQIAREFSWPKSDPRTEWQPTRTLVANDEARARLLSISPHFNLLTFLERTKNLDLISRIIELLNHSAYQFNSRKIFRESTEWKKRIVKACAENRPIEILILAFCVISNPTKRVQSTNVTLAEDVSLLHMNQIARHIEHIYPPGAIFQVISDSTFYALPFGVTSVEAQSYINQLRRRVGELQITDTIKILDITDYLTEHNQFFQNRFTFWRKIFLASPVTNELTANEYQRWHASMRCSLNSRRMGFEYEQLAILFSSYPDKSIDNLDELATVALAEYRALKAAAADTEWENRYFPNAIRATIHSKKIPVLGLRLYPKYKLSSNLLPYHGIAVISPGKNNECEQMVVQHEISVIGNPHYTKVINENGITKFYELTKPIQ